jgi:hypothetical protein
MSRSSHPNVTWLLFMMTTLCALTVLYVDVSIIAPPYLLFQSLENLQPDVMIGHLQDSKPKIYQVQFGEC